MKCRGLGNFTTCHETEQGTSQHNDTHKNKIFDIIKSSKLSTKMYKSCSNTIS